MACHILPCHRCSNSNHLSHVPCTHQLAASLSFRTAFLNYGLACVHHDFFPFVFFVANQIRSLCTIRLGLRGIFGSGPGSGSTIRRVAPASGVQPFARHASATSSSGCSQPSPLLDLSFQNFPNAWRQTVCVHSGHSAHFRLISATPVCQPCARSSAPPCRAAAAS